MLEGPIILKMTDKDIAEAETTPVPAPAGGGGRGNQAAFRQKLADFYVQERRRRRSSIAAATATWPPAAAICRGSSSIPTAARSSRAARARATTSAGKSVPAIALAVEHYNRMIRVLDKSVPVKVELNVETKFYDETTPNGFNTIAEIPGHRSRVGESCCSARTSTRIPYATGATDNATGSGAMMEAMRILKAVGAKPRRTIRIGAVGRRGAGPARLARLRARALRRRRDDGAEAGAREDRRLLQLRQRHRQGPRHLAAEQHGGRARSSKQWMAPLHDLGVTTLGPRSVGVDRSRVVRRRRHPGVSVHGRSARVQLADAPLEHGHVRSRPARRHDPAGDGDRGVRLRRGDARREAAAQGAAGAAASSRFERRRPAIARVGRWSRIRRMHKISAGIAAALASSVLLAAQAQPANPNAPANFIKFNSPLTVLTHVRVIDGTGAPRARRPDDRHPRRPHRVSRRRRADHVARRRAASSTSPGKQRDARARDDARAPVLPDGPGVYGSSARASRASISPAASRRCGPAAT